MELNLNTNEICFIEVVRDFDFLRPLGYYGESFFIYDRDPSITFRNWSLHMTIFIQWYDPNYFGFSIHREKLFRRKYFELKDIYHIFDHQHLLNNIGQYNIRKIIYDNSVFVKKYLLPVIKGEVWIDELIKQYKKQGNE